MAKYKAYPEYKDSGVEWLRDIPKHWNVTPIGRLFWRLKRTGYIYKTLLSVYRDYGVIPKTSRDDNYNKPSEDLSPYQLVKPNDLVMNKMKAWQGSIAISEYEGIVSPAYFVYPPNAKLFEVAYPKYIHYLLRNPMYIAQYLRRSKGIRVNQWDLDPDEFQKIELLLPTKDEQLKIFNFLDHETTKIDTLIEKQQQLIALLKEKRQAVISHAVTKGLNPDASMKNSGVEWLGEVPEHWRITRMKYISLLTPKKPVIQRNLHCSFVPMEKLKTNSIVLDETRIIDDVYDGYTYFKDADILMAKVTPCFENKNIAVAKNLVNSIGFGSSEIYVIRANEDISNRFLYYRLQEDSFMETATASMTGAGGLKRVPSDFINNYIITLPNLSEQQRIAEFLDPKCSVFSKLIENTESMITLMQEKRTSLISAAVTGKIDVRNWQDSRTSNKEEMEKNNKEALHEFTR
ncbi:restriction endonuclease subunit S [Thiotrichales bacterium 19S3-7]|nr:restriction endonuclease subunit S [Thiotrichales bacterium 19S3-7]MCF6800610.1 restriction endonuclease subunit S [Thiotrichales bacterium 19S3-11]